MSSARAVIGLVAVAACGAPPERLVSPPPVAPPPRAASSAPKPVRTLPVAARPSLDIAAVLPAPPGDRPWPLSELPSVQPHWDPAMARDACSDEWAARHAHDRDALGYIAAWCRIQASDHGAIDQLARVAREARQEIAKPARLDVINLIADWMDGRHACAWLDSWSLGSSENLDLLAATYLALGMRADAEFAADTVVSRDIKPALDVVCRRYLQYGKLDDPDLVRRVHALAGARGDCGQLAAQFACVIDLVRPYYVANDVRCFPTTKDDPVLAGKIRVAELYLGWVRRNEGTYVGIASEARVLLAIPGVEELAVSALEHAVTESACDRNMLATIVNSAGQLRAADRHSSFYDARLVRLPALVHRHCP